MSRVRQHQITPRLQLFFPRLVVGLNAAERRGAMSDEWCVSVCRGRKRAGRGETKAKRERERESALVKQK
jgi:hypothetical protein